MKNSLDEILISSFQSQNEFTFSSPKIELYDINMQDIDGNPNGKFCCEFMDEGHNVRIIGTVEFDKNGYVSKENDNPRLNPILIVVDTLTVDASNSKYNLWKASKKNVQSEQQKTSEDNGSYIKSAQEKAVSQLKLWGAKDAYISSDKYLIYVVDEASLSASPDEVAHSMYDLFSDVPGIVGIRVVSASSGRTIGEY